MKKLIYLVLILSLFSSCGTKQEQVDKIIEDGVEVVLNHIEPYQIRGEPTTFNLEELFTIDTEYFDMARIGLTDISCFDVDSKGNIYFLKQFTRKGNNIFKFDKNGRYVTSFGSKGQGPGEFQYAYHLEINNQDNIVVTDQLKFRLIIFRNDGTLNREITLDNQVFYVTPLQNGSFLSFAYIRESTREEYFKFSLRMHNSQFEVVKELDGYKRASARITKRFKGTDFLFCWNASKGKIYIGNEDREYEILAFDLDGNLIQKIKKEYKKMPVSEEYKKKRMEIITGQLKEWTYFPKFFPPYLSFLTDDRGRLLVMTYEDGENPGEFMFDIFSPDGVFIGRKSINVLVWSGPLKAKMKQNLLYCLQEKESGYRKLVVYEVSWEK